MTASSPLPRSTDTRLIALTKVLHQHQFDILPSALPPQLISFYTRPSTHQHSRQQSASTKEDRYSYHIIFPIQHPTCVVQYEQPCTESGISNKDSGPFFAADAASATTALLSRSRSRSRSLSLSSLGDHLAPSSSFLAALTHSPFFRVRPRDASGPHLTSNIDRGPTGGEVHGGECDTAAGNEPPPGNFGHILNTSKSSHHTPRPRQTRPRLLPFISIIHLSPHTSPSTRQQQQQQQQQHPSFKNNLSGVQSTDDIATAFISKMTSNIHISHKSAMAAPPPTPMLARTPPMSIPMRATTSRPSSSSSTLSTMSTAESARSFRAAWPIHIVAGAGGPSRCAFPCWPDRRALDAAPEEYTSAYISDADLFPDDEPCSAPALMETRPTGADDSFPFQVQDEEILDEVVVCPRVRVRRPRPAGFDPVLVIPGSSSNQSSRRPSTESTQRRRRPSRRTAVTPTRKAPGADGRLTT